MTKRRVTMLLLLLLVAATVSGIAWAQYGRGERRWQGDSYDSRNGVPTWDTDQEYKHDVFTFVRIEYSSWSDGYRRQKWQTDMPDSDLNFSYRLQELTSMKVDPNGKVVRLTDPELFDYPFIYIVEPGEMSLTEPEVLGLRKYLEKGGFLMVDDFWGEDEYLNFYRELKRVFPKREPVELPLEHEIFHCVYDLKEKPQIPSINHYWGGRRTERWDAQEPDYRAVFDDNERIMVMICHNTDTGDGWEREGLDSGYFKEYSEKWAYPLGINIITYAMTH